MASIYDLKPRFQKLLRPVIGTLVRAGITPNIVTLTALLGSAWVGSDFLRHAARPHWGLLPLWLFIRMALNAIDGMMARDHDMKTVLGGVLNELGDVLSDAVLYLPLAYVVPSAAPGVVCFVLVASLTEFCGVLSQALGASRRYDGPMGKSDRAFLVGALALAAPLVVFPAAFAVATVLGLLTCRNRIQGLLRELS